LIKESITEKPVAVIALGLKGREEKRRGEETREGRGEERNGGRGRRTIKSTRTCELRNSCEGSQVVEGGCRWREAEKKLLLPVGEVIYMRAQVMSDGSP
jgi:hypothetical protein